MSTREANCLGSCVITIFFFFRGHLESGGPRDCPGQWAPEDLSDLWDLKAHQDPKVQRSDLNRLQYSTCTTDRQTDNSS